MRHTDQPHVGVTLFDVGNEANQRVWSDSNFEAAESNAYLLTETRYEIFGMFQNSTTTDFFSSCPLMQRLCKPWSFTPVQSKVDASNFSPSSRKASIDFRQSWEKQHWEIGNGRSIKELYNENAFTRTYHCILESLLTYQQHYIKWMFDDFCHFWIAIGHGKLLVLMTSEERIVALGLEEPPQ